MAIPLKKFKSERDITDYDNNLTAFDESQLCNFISI